MDLIKTKIYLDKLNREFSRLSKDPENIARIDVDIMLAYVRELYDAVLTDGMLPGTVSPRQDSGAAPTNHHRRHAAADSRPASAVPAEIPQAPEPVRQAAPPAQAAPTPPPPVRETPRQPAYQEPQPAAPAAPAVVAAPQAPPAPEAPPPAPVREAPAPAPRPAAATDSNVPPEVEILFEEKQARELSEKLSDLPIADLRRSIALNDRLLLTRELFAGDASAFETAINTLNALTNFGDAKVFLVNNYVGRYAWMDKKRFEQARNFIKLVRRRYK